MRRLTLSLFLIVVCIFSINIPISSSSNMSAKYIGAEEIREASFTDDPNIPEKQPRWVYESSGTVNLVAVSSNGSYVCMGTDQGYVYLFNTSSKTVLSNVYVGGSIGALDISYYGEYLAAAAGNLIKVYKINAGSLEYLWSFTNNPGDGDGGIHSLSFSSNGSVLAVGTWFRGSYWYGRHGYSYVHLFDTLTGNKLWSNNINVGGGDVSDYVSVDISSDGQYIVAGSTYNPKVYLFTKASSTPIFTPFPADSSVNSISMSATGQYYVVGSSSVYYFSKDAPGPQWLIPFNSVVTSVSISDDGTYITATNQTHLYLIKNDQTKIWNYELPQSRAMISADGNYIAAQSSSNAYLFFRTQEAPLWVYPAQSQYKSISISSNGRYSAYTSGNKMLFFDLYHKADLVPTKITFSGTQPNEGDTIQVNATVSNLGLFKSYYVQVQLFDNDTLVGQAQIDPLSPGESIIASINYTCLPDYRTLRIYVDSWLTQTYESNYTNNAISSSLYVNARPENVTLYIPMNPSSSSLDLSWSKNMDSDFARYEVWIWDSSKDDWTLLETIIDQHATNYVATNLTASTKYWFFVRVVDTRNAFSDSNLVSATTLPTSVPLSVPKNPKQTSLDLEWFRNIDSNFECYEVYKSASFGELGSLVVRITNQSETTYTVTGLQASTTYYFTVRVVNPEGLFSDSNQVSGTTLPTPVHLYNPSDLTTSSLTLTWRANEDLNFERYEIYVSTDAETLGRLVISLSDQFTTTYRVTGLNHSTTYYFVIRVVGLEGLFSDSNQVSATTLGPGWDFAISISPTSQTVAPGGSTSYTVTITGFGEKASGKNIQLSISGLPAGTTFQFIPSSVTPDHTSTLSITTSSFTEEDIYTLTIIATSDELTKTETITLVVRGEGIDHTRWLYVLLGITITGAIATAVILAKRRQRTAFSPKTKLDSSSRALGLGSLMLNNFS